MPSRSALGIRDAGTTIAKFARTVMSPSVRAKVAFLGAGVAAPAALVGTDLVNAGIRRIRRRSTGTRRGTRGPLRRFRAKPRRRPRRRVRGRGRRRSGFVRRRRNSRRMGNRRRRR